MSGASTALTSDVGSAAIGESPFGVGLSGAYPSRVTNADFQDRSGFQGWREVRKVAETKSTNADLVLAADAGEAEGLVLVADRQTAGRGRLDRSWDSPPGSGL